jgi:hypothetical protein
MRVAAWTLAGLVLSAPIAQAGTASIRTALLPAWVGDHPRFGWSGAWLFPVGSPYEIGRPGPEGSPAYRINRCIGGPEEGGGKHQGADLSCGHGGDLVRAAGQGLVVKAEAHGWNGGYGRHVVIAHRLVDGGLVYSVYAHLLDQSLRVHKGQVVAAGQALGRVGRSGRASSEHLHFEVRLATGQDEAWQNAEVLDPITFVTEHLPTHEPLASADAPYLEWAECAALLQSADRADSTLERATWWQMMARAARQSRDDFPDETEGVKQMLIGEGVLDAGSGGRSGQRHQLAGSGARPAPAEEGGHDGRAPSAHPCRAPRAVRARVRGGASHPGARSAREAPGRSAARRSVRRARRSLQLVGGHEEEAEGAEAAGVRPGAGARDARHPGERTG